MFSMLIGVMASAMAVTIQTEAFLQSLESIILCRDIDQVDTILATEVLQFIAVCLVALVVIITYFFIRGLYLYLVNPIGQFV